MGDFLNCLNCLNLLNFLNFLVFCCRYKSAMSRIRNKTGLIVNLKDMSRFGKEMKLITKGNSIFYIFMQKNVFVNKKLSFPIHFSAAKKLLEMGPT